MHFMLEQIRRIAEKVKAQGARLLPPLAETDALAFEQKHQITLPKGYRNFLLQIGNGGEGPPYYGVEPLGKTPRDMNPSETETWTCLRDIQKPFPFTRDWTWEGGEETDEGGEEHISHGSIRIGNDGCGAYWHLIVTGPERGNVWMICGEGIGAACPKRDFLQWYEDWLDGKDSFYGYPQ
jgi:SMI1/KNR4 family protein SUKH-1